MQESSGCCSNNGNDIVPFQCCLVSGRRHTGLPNYGTTDWRDLEQMKQIALVAKWADPFPDLGIISRPSAEQLYRNDLDTDGDKVPGDENARPSEDAIEPFVVYVEPVEELLEDLGGKWQT